PSRVADGTLVLGGDKTTLARFGTSFGNFELRFDYRVEGKGDAIRWVKNGDDKSGSGVELKPTTEKGWYQLVTTASYEPSQHALQVTRKALSPTGKDLGESALPVMAKGNQNRVELEVPAGTTLALRNIRLRPLQLTSIFNGKDLSGWKEHPGKKSKF